jgi:serine/threonine protein kinase
MGNCWVKKTGSTSSDIIENDEGEKRRKVNKRSLISAQTEMSKETRIDSLDMIPGEEELYSKTININHFDVVKVIGRGSFGKVYLVKNKDNNEFYAMKVLKKEAISSPNQRLHTIAERRILQEIDSKFVVKLHYAFQNPDKLYFVMDFLNGGEMFTHLRKNIKFSEKRARFYAAEMVLALKDLHDNKILYRDLKPENVILGSDGHIKITDFGLSKMNINKVNDLTFTFWGTPEYLAPEIIGQKGHDKSVDWWSLGTILYEMLAGRAPFANKNKQKVLRDVLKAPVLMKKSFSPKARDLLQKLLERDPKKRLGYGIKDAEELMEHPFFESIDWEKLKVHDVKPPYIPKVKKVDDLRHIDPLFKEEKVQDTPAQNQLSIGKKMVNHFDEFTYNKDHILVESKTQDVNSDNDNLSKILEDEEYIDAIGHTSVEIDL